MKTKTQKREDAAARQAAHDRLSGFDKLAKTFERRGESRRERARLTAGVV